MTTQAITTSGSTGRRKPPVLTRKPKNTPGDKAVGVLSHTALVIWTLIVILPLLWTLMTSLQDDQGDLRVAVLARPRAGTSTTTSLPGRQAGIGNYFLNTVIVVGFALVIVMVLGAMCAYVLARYKFPGSRAIYYLMLAGLTFPIFLAIVPLFFVLRNIGLLNTLPGLILTYVAFALPFTVFFLYSFFKATAGRDRRGRRHRRRRGVADLLPGHAADGEAGASHPSRSSTSSACGTSSSCRWP